MKPIYIRTTSNSNYRMARVPELKAKELPEKLRLSPFEVIDNLTGFVKTHAEIARHNNGNPTFKPYYDRLLKVNNNIDEVVARYHDRQIRALLAPLH